MIRRKRKRMPRQKPGASKQDYQTPVEFLAAVSDRFGRIVHDLACTTANAVARSGFYFDRGYDGLAADWTDLAAPGEVLWLNPEFGKIAPWAEKCATYAGRGLVTMLIPAAVSTNYFAESQGFPKDLMLCVYGMGLRGFEPWRWTS